MALQDWRERVSKVFGKEPEWLASLGDVFNDATCWFDTELPGTKVIHLPPVDRAVSGYISRAPAGALIPLHRHDGRETVLVLQGGFVEEPGGRRVRPGDVLVSEPGTSHLVRIDEDDDCIVVVRMDFVGRPKERGIDSGLSVIKNSRPDNAR